MKGLFCCVAITQNTGFHFSLPLICSSDDLHLGRALDFLTRRYLTSAFLAVLMRRSKRHFWNHRLRLPFVSVWFQLTFRCLSFHPVPFHRSCLLPLLLVRPSLDWEVTTEVGRLSVTRVTLCKWWENDSSAQLNETRTWSDLNRINWFMFLKLHNMDRVTKTHNSVAVLEVGLDLKSTFLVSPSPLGLIKGLPSRLCQNCNDTITEKNPAAALFRSICNNQSYKTLFFDFICFFFILWSKVR